MRDYTQIDQYINELQGDVYQQPPDPQHSSWAAEVIRQWIPALQPCKTVLDVGCGQGFCKEIFEKLKGTSSPIEWTGVTLGEDFVIATEKGYPVYNADMSFLPFGNDKFDLIFARHTLEHSPMPLLTLMEWHRVSKQWLCVITPTPDFWTYIGKNHYSVMHNTQLRWLLSRAGWHPIWSMDTDQEIRLMCEKVIRQPAS